MYSYAAFRYAKTIRGDDTSGTYGEEADVYMFGATVYSLATNEGFNNCTENLNEVFEELGEVDFLNHIAENGQKIKNEINTTFPKPQR